jgi:RimJ/RimL family protein N-acetyltransferase
VRPTFPALDIPAGRSPRGFCPGLSGEVGLSTIGIPFEPSLEPIARSLYWDGYRSTRGEVGWRTMSLPIETSRLLLRRYRSTDMADIVRYSSHPSIARLINWSEPDGNVTDRSVRKFIEAQGRVHPGDSAWMDLAIALKMDDRVIGSIGIICREHRQGQIGWALAVEHRGRGLATEAAAAMIDYGFRELGCHRIYAMTTNWNERSWRLMERVGMRREACFRESEFADGAWRDGLIYAILESDDRGPPASGAEPR